MARVTTFGTTLVALVFFHLTLSRTACAYLDPGTGSYVLQLIIAALLGGVFALKVFWNEVKAFMTSLFSRGRHEEAED